jgi:hypothetical protein
LNVAGRPSTVVGQPSSVHTTVVVSPVGEAAIVVDGTMNAAARTPRVSRMLGKRRRVRGCMGISFDERFAVATMTPSCEDGVKTRRSWSPASDGPRESYDPGRLTTRVGIYAGSADRGPVRTERIRSAAALAAEAIAAVDGLAARRAERDLGVLAAR